MKKLLIFLLAVNVSFSMMAQNGDLKLNLEKNKVYRFKSENSQNVSQSVNGMEQTTTTLSKSYASIKMMDATAQFIIAEVKFDSISTTTNAMGKTTVMNSATPGIMSSDDVGSVMSLVMSRLSKSPIYAKIAPNGQVLEIVNQAMVQDVVLKDTATLSAKLKPVLITQIKAVVGGDALKTMISSYTYNLPVKPVKSGDLWTISNPMNSGGMSLEIVTSYKLTNVQNNTGTIASESTFKAAAGAAPMEYPGAKITYDGLTGIGKTDMTLNMLTGLVIKSITKATISCDLGVSASGMNMTIPMKITSESNVVAL